MNRIARRPFQILFQAVRSRYGSVHFQLLDQLILGYAVLIPVLILLFNSRVQHEGIYLLGHAAVIAGILELLRLEARLGGFLLRFLRTYYPMLLLILAWTEIGKLINLIFPFWLNRFVMSADLWLFGIHPTVWVERIFSPLLTEAMNFFYFSYYLFVPIATFPLYFTGKVQETFDMLFLFFLSYLASYILFMIFPAEGPRFILNHLHTQEPAGGLFLKLNSLFQSRAEIRGGCIPSSHVSVATTGVLACFRMNRPAAFILLFLTAGIAMATVYCRYHHAVDSLMGLVAGFLFYWVGTRFLKSRRQQTAP
jgi:membrane-associated phospholipid phosphatase